MLAAVFDVEKIPGKRSLRRSSTAMPELALMADSDPADQLYPLDIDRALAKIASIKDHSVFWDSGASSVDLRASGEAVMGYMRNTRANEAKNMPASRVDDTFRGGFLIPALRVVPKGNPAGTACDPLRLRRDEAPKGQLDPASVGLAAE